MAVYWGVLTEVVAAIHPDGHAEEVQDPWSAQIQKGIDCFYCGDVMFFPAIFWHGELELFLHPECARMLATRLLTDFETAQDGRAAYLKRREDIRRKNDELREAHSKVAVLRDQIEELQHDLALLRQADEENREVIDVLNRTTEHLVRVRPEAPSASPVRLDPQRSFSVGQKKEIYLRADGHCVGCGRPLDSDWHADHVVPHARGGRTEIINGQALCQPCNSRKHAKVLTVDGE